MQSVFRPLGHLEEEIMQIIWQCDQVTVREVYEHVHKHRSIAYTTIMTIMDRLAKKNMLQRVKVGRAYAYEAKITQNDFNSHVSRSIIDTLLQHYGDLAISQFIDAVDKVDPKKLEQLKRRGQ
jgi:predicted transcriptional regulator